MYQMSLEALASNIGYQYYGPHDVTAQAVVIDSREVKPGVLFVALGGEKNNGHHFIEHALQAGAVGVVVSEQEFLEQPKHVGVIYAEAGGAHFLQALARFWRAKFTGPVVAITGSQGKTSTKDLLGQVLQEEFHLVVTKENQNNELGLPLTMTQLNEDTDVLLVEMGMDDYGDINFLSDIARPTHGLITGIGLAHAERLGSQEGIARAKAELIHHLPEDGCLVLRSIDTPWLEGFLEDSPAPVLWCCRDEQCVDGHADYVATDICQSSDASSFTCKVASDGAVFDMQVPFAGAHYIDNTLLVIAMARSLGVSVEKIQHAVANAHLQSSNRMAYHLLSDGRLLINDSYNANPDSMKATIDVLARFAPRQTVACLGDMRELGPYEQSEHQKLGKLVAESGINRLITVGQIAQEIANGARMAGMPDKYLHVCADNTCAAETLHAIMESGAVALIKGSHGVRMDEICVLMRDLDLRRDHSC